MKPSPCSVSADAAPAMIGSATSPPGSNSAQNSSPPMRYARPAPRQVGREVRAQPHEQRVAGGVAEGVVVVLEAVEVEEHEHDRARVVGLGQQRGELARQRAAVAEAGQRVGQRLVARGAQHRDVLAERQHQPRHHRDQRQRGERHGDRVEVGQAAVDQHRQADRAEPERHGDEAQPVGRRRAAARPAGCHDGERDQQQPERPADVVPGGRLQRARAPISTR